MGSNRQRVRCGFDAERQLLIHRNTDSNSTKGGRESGRSFFVAVCSACFDTARISAWKSLYPGKASRMFLGLDSSTQSLTAVLIQPSTGEIVCQISVNFGADLPQYGSPSGFIPGGVDGEVHSNPLMWLDALDLLFGRLADAADLSQVAMIAGSGQQHGSVYLDATFDQRITALDPEASLSSQISPALTRRTSPIWMDTSTGAECAEITAALATLRQLHAASALQVPRSGGFPRWIPRPTLAPDGFIW